MDFTLLTPHAVDLFTLVMAFIFGMMFVSFFNVVGHRFLTDQSVVSPPSHCPQCKTPIHWYDNLPVVSWLFLGGQCRKCKLSISVLYPLMEIFTGLLFALVVWKAGLGLQALLLLFLVSNLVVIFITDLKESLIFQINSLSLIPAGLLYSFLDLGKVSTVHHSIFGLFSVPESFVSAILGILVAFIFFEGMILLSEMVFGTEGFGHGDTHLMMGVGAFLGWPGTIAALLLGFVVQAVPAFPLLVWQWIQSKNWVSLAAVSGGVIFSILPNAFMGLGLSPGTNALLTMASFVLALVCLFIFLRRIRQSESFTYMPLGPALVLASLAILFFGPQLWDLWQSTLPA